MGKDRGGVQMAFSWGDAFQPRDRPQSTLVAYEKASVLRYRMGLYRQGPDPLHWMPSSYVSVGTRHHLLIRRIS